MPYLLLVTLIQALSFNLIGAYLAGHVDSYFAVLARVLIAGLVFIPLTRWRQVPASVVRRLLLIGALQFGVTYVCLYLSFRVLSVPEVLLFTILTPLHVTLIEDALNRRFNPWGLLAALTAVIGAAVIRYDRISTDFFLGFVLLQVANFTYAAGQVLYKHLQARSPGDEPQYRRFGYFFVGALLVALPAYLAFGNLQRLPQTSLQWTVLVFLGLIATAFGMYAWNKGASQVGGATLAAMNNLHVPVGLLLNLLLWNKQEPLARLAAGAAIILLSVWIARRSARRPLASDRSAPRVDHL
ncbi:carboxylate/amino acid/amine transporter [Pseudomonas sp. HR96]|uniref:carboxylate/amino acid/amine transporter n=1 Tax=Pseudomonas sp. HR96 TaxID=1027966 RepID=UPI002A74853A|nr:carboxylate/amino acid/amine transporter [Pseudomonas sp. HR96]WPP01192.1 carboxylate/amino acid/amine transporter [Pseudomonas sp. HR96]